MYGPGLDLRTIVVWYSRLVIGFGIDSTGIHMLDENTKVGKFVFVGVI